MCKRYLTLFVLAAVLLCVMGADARSKHDSREEAQTSSNALEASPAKADTIVDPPIPWPLYFGVQQTGIINTSFDCFGNIGLYYFPYVQHGFPRVSYGWSLSSFEVPPGSDVEYLYGGSIWVGGIVGDDTLVSTGMDGWIGIREMYPTGNQPTVTKFSYATDYSLRAEFNDTSVVLGGVDYVDDDRSHIPLGIRISNRSHVWRTEPEQNTVIYDMVIQNIGSEMIEDAYIGYHFDGDVCFKCYSETGSFHDDVSGAIRSHGIGYIIDDDGELNDPMGRHVPRAFGFKILAGSFVPPDTNFNWWISNGDKSRDFGPQQKAEYCIFAGGGRGTPTTDRGKYCILSLKEWDYDQIFTGTIGPDDSMWQDPTPDSLIYDFGLGSDTRFLMSIGPVDLHPGQSERIQYATFTSDAVHTDPYNIQNLPQDPDAYLANLDLSSLIENAALSDSLAGILRDPLLPPTGLQIVSEDAVSATVRWDPWCFDDVTGYEIYLTEVPLDSLPYPGVVPPWLRLNNVTPVVNLGPDEIQYTFMSLVPTEVYMADLAHESGAGTGEKSEPVVIGVGQRTPAPRFEIEYVFAEPGESIELSWSPPGGVYVDHYNIYRFDSLEAAADTFHAFYDEGFAVSVIEPKDSFDVDGKVYYYYAMNIYDQVPGMDTTFSEVADDGTTYAVTAVDEFGFESEFSIAVEVGIVEPPSRDILAVLGAQRLGLSGVVRDRLLASYETLLTGYDYDLLDWYDSTAPYGSANWEHVDWHDLARYRLVIIDGDFREICFDPDYEAAEAGYTKYLLSGGRLAYFGALVGLGGAVIDLAGDTYQIEHDFIRRFFAVDSLYHAGLNHFSEYPPSEDTFFGFHAAVPVQSSQPFLHYDSLSSVYNPIVDLLWPNHSSPPAVSGFYTDESAEITHMFGPGSGVSSVMEGLSVGLKTITPHSETHLFGFHLWYMDSVGAQALIRTLMEGQCCLVRGNVNGLTGPVSGIDASDIVYLIDYFWNEGNPSPCPEEANVNAASGPVGEIDVIDLAYLIDYLYNNGPAPDGCPE